MAKDFCVLILLNNSDVQVHVALSLSYLEHDAWLRLGVLLNPLLDQRTSEARALNGAYIIIVDRGVCGLQGCLLCPNISQSEAQCCCDNQYNLFHTFNFNF